ncbi:MAG: ATP-binding cassette domain-containing protein [Myxococcales bacterium]|nr:ATP-binding cassette domain-containing protein [Myxococcales bacterium]USN51442.1 MAG: ATP-binding cassette domain-containing protein [Myxococcales bacterium]
MTVARIKYFSLWHIDPSDARYDHKRHEIEKILYQVADYFLLPKAVLRLPHKLSLMDALNAYAFQLGLGTHLYTQEKVSDMHMPLIARNKLSNGVSLLLPHEKNKFVVIEHNAKNYLIKSSEVEKQFSEILAFFPIQSHASSPVSLISKLIKKYFSNTVLFIISLCALALLSAFFYVVTRFFNSTGMVNILVLTISALFLILSIFAFGKLINFVSHKNYLPSMLLARSLLYQRFFSGDQQDFFKKDLFDFFQLKEKISDDIKKYLIDQKKNIFCFLMVFLNLFLVLWWNQSAAIIYSVFILLSFGIKKIIAKKYSALKKEFRLVEKLQSQYVEAFKATFGMSVSFGGLDALLGKISENWENIRKLKLKLKTLKFSKENLKVVFPLLLLTVSVGFIFWWQIQLSFNEMIIVVIDALLVGYALARYSFKLLREPLSKDTAKELSSLNQKIFGLKVLPINLTGRIELLNVSFHYDDASFSIFKNINVVVEAGKFYQIIGPSGRGKSTLLKLMSGFIFSKNGEVLLDGQDIKSLDIDATRAHFGVVSQESSLFAGTIYDNIICGRKISHKKLEELLLSYEIFDYILDLPLGLQSYVFGHGNNLSKAQILIILLARALIHEPKILFMDEIFEGIDATEQKNLKDFLSSINITRLLVSHQALDIKNTNIINSETFLLKNQS